jgi:hypothetical protein
LREQIRKIQEEKRLALKNSEKQRTEIFQAFKKQVQLVDNLKKQKVSKCNVHLNLKFYIH